MKRRTEIQAKYDKENMVFIGIKLHKKYDKDILDNINMQNKQGSIKELIRKGLNNNNNNID